MPTFAEIEAAVRVLHAAREKSRTSLSQWPSIEDEVRMVLEAAEAARAVTRNPGNLPKTTLTPDE
jgi:hypothetical protein